MAPMRYDKYHTFDIIHRLYLVVVAAMLMVAVMMVVIVVVAVEGWDYLEHRYLVIRRCWKESSLFGKNWIIHKKIDGISCFISAMYELHTHFIFKSLFYFIFTVTFFICFCGSLHYMTCVYEVMVGFYLSYTFHSLYVLNKLWNIASYNFVNINHPWESMNSKPKRAKTLFLINMICLKIIIIIIFPPIWK